MAAAGYNLRHWIIKREEDLIFALFCIIEKWAIVHSLLRRRERWLALQPIPVNLENYGFYKD
ncbi:MAG: hypothetical protein EOM11_10480 [Erysipelotrichia bacterium]|nr:hypothetical protein [Erysipelotrichia bacterium]